MHVAFIGRIPMSRQRERTRESYLRRKYGITIAEYDWVFKRQKGCCATCEQPETMLDSSGRIRSLIVETSAKGIRLVCMRCFRIGSDRWYRPRR